MSTERRNDVGSKIIVVVVSLLLGVIMTITWTTAREAMGGVVTNKVEVAVLQTETVNLKNTLSDHIGG